MGRGRKNTFSQSKRKLTQPWNKDRYTIIRFRGRRSGRSEKINLEPETLNFLKGSVPAHLARFLTGGRFEVTDVYETNTSDDGFIMTYKPIQA